MSVDNDKFAADLNKALQKSKNEKINNEKMEHIKSVLAGKEGRQFFICLEKHVNENPPPSIINASLIEARDKKNIEIIHETFTNLSSSFKKANDFSLYQCSEAFKKEYQGLEIINVYYNTLNDKENSELKKAISAAELKYSKHASDISKLRTFLSNCPNANEADIVVLYPPITADLGILRWLIIAIDNIDLDIIKILLTLPKEIMKIVFDDMFDNKDDVIYKPIIEKEYYYFFNNTWGFLNTVYNCCPFGDNNFMTSYTILSLVLQQFCSRPKANPEVQKMLDLLLDNSNKENMNMNFAFNRNPTNVPSQRLPNGNRNYLHDLIEGVCNTRAYQNSETPRLACKALDTLIQHGFTDFNLNHQRKDSPFACLVDAFTKNRIAKDIFHFITNHLISVCNININYKIQSNAINTPNASDFASDETHDNFFRCRSPFHIAITGGHYLPYGSALYGDSFSHWYQVRTENLLKERAGIAFDFLLQDMQRALLGEFEAMADDVLPTLVLPRDSDQNNHLRARWCRTLQEYTWSLGTKPMSKVDANSQSIEQVERAISQLYLRSYFHQSLDDMDALGDPELSAEDLKLLNVSNAFANKDPDKRSISDFSDLWDNGNTENQSSAKNVEPVSSKDASLSTNVHDIPYANTNASIDTKETADKNQFALVSRTPNPFLSLNAANPNQNFPSATGMIAPNVIIEPWESSGIILSPENANYVYQPLGRLDPLSTQTVGMNSLNVIPPTRPPIESNAIRVERGSTNRVSFTQRDLNDGRVFVVSGGALGGNGISASVIDYEPYNMYGDVIPSAFDGTVIKNIINEPVKPRPGMYSNTNSSEKHQEFHEKLTRQLTGFYLHCPVSQSIRESTVAGYYFNMYPDFPLSQDMQNIVAEYLSYAVMIPGQQTKMNPSITRMTDNNTNNTNHTNPRPILLAFNRGRDKARELRASLCTDEQMEETLVTLAKSDIFDQVSVCQQETKRLEFKKLLDEKITELKAQLEPFQIWAGRKNQNDTKLQKIHKDHCEQVLRHFLDKFSKKNRVAFREIFAAIPKSPFHTEREWRAIGTAYLETRQQNNLQKPVPLTQQYGNHLQMNANNFQNGAGQSDATRDMTNPSTLSVPQGWSLMSGYLDALA